MSTSRHVREKDAHLTILHPSGRSAILHTNARRLVASFEKARLVDDQDGGLSAQLLYRVGSHVVADPIDIPFGTGEQALHAKGCGFSGMFGQLPAIFALDGTEQSLQVEQRPPTRFWSGKARGKTSMQLGKGLTPLGNVGRGCLCFTWWSRVRMLHFPLLSLGHLCVVFSSIQSATWEREDDEACFCV